MQGKHEKPQTQLPVSGFRHQPWALLSQIPTKFDITEYVSVGHNTINLFQSYQSSIYGVIK